MSKKILKWILYGAAAVIGLIGAMMLFAPALKVDSFLGTETTSGATIAFGNKDEGFAVSAYLLPFFLALIGVALVVVAALGKGGKVVPIAAAVCFVVAGALFFLPKQFAMADLSDVPEAGKEQVKELFKADMDLCDIGAGAIVGGIFSIIAAVVSVVPIFVCKEN